jgi:integrase
MSAEKLPPGIDKLPSGKYRARLAAGPGRRALTATFTRQRDAERQREKWLIAKENGTLDQIDGGRQTLAELAAEHMTAARPDLADSTYAVYRSLWSAHVKDHAIAAMPLRSIRPEAVEDFKADLRANGAGEVSIRKTLALLQTILSRAVLYGRIASNPVTPVKKPSARRTRQVNAISPAEVERIRAQLKGADAVLVSVLAYAGLRPGEARALTWADLKAKTIHVHAATNPDGTIKPTKTEQSRSVRMVAALKSDLAEWRKASGDPGDAALIFPRADGQPWTETDFRNWRRRKFSTAVERAGVNLSRPYDLRHSAASLWLHEGIGPIQVAKWLGHNPSETFKTYAHIIEDLDPDDRQPADDVIAAARRDKPMTRMGVKSGQALSKRSEKGSGAKPHGKRAKVKSAA